MPTRILLAESDSVLRASLAEQLQHEGCEVVAAGNIDDAAHAARTGTFAFAIIGEGLDSIIAAQASAHAMCVAEEGLENCSFDLSLSSLVTTELLLAFAALGVVSLLPVAFKKWKRLT